MEDLQRALKSQKQWRLRPEILLGDNIPKPMHGVAPREILGSSWWNQTRKAAYASTNFHCNACGVHKSQARFRKWLEGHELYEVNYLRGKMIYIETVPLCIACHSYVHDGRLRALLEKKEVSHQKFVAIIRHGEDVLKAAGLSRLSYEEREQALNERLLDGEVAPWSSWRLVLFGEEYPPKFKSEVQWRRAFE
jgi:hypothetical protein